MHVKVLIEARYQLDTTVRGGGYIGGGGWGMGGGLICLNRIFSININYDQVFDGENEELK